MAAKMRGRSYLCARSGSAASLDSTHHSERMGGDG